jgi:hypothetical protein
MWEFPYHRRSKADRENKMYSRSRRAGQDRRRKWLVAIVLLLFVPTLGLSQQRTNTPKVLYLFKEDDRLVASNVQFNRFDELKLLANEKIQDKIVAQSVAVVVTNERMIAYSALIAAWQIVKRRAREKIVEVQAADFSASVVTTDRFLNFNGRNAVWAERRR